MKRLDTILNILAATLALGTLAVVAVTVITCAVLKVTA